MEKLTEEQIKANFKEIFVKFKSGELNGHDVSAQIQDLLYHHVYDNEIQIKDSALISAMELAGELGEVQKDSEDYNRVVGPIEEYFSS